MLNPLWRSYTIEALRNGDVDVPWWMGEIRSAMNYTYRRGTYCPVPINILLDWAARGRRWLRVRSGRTWFENQVRRAYLDGMAEQSRICDENNHGENNG